MYAVIPVLVFVRSGLGMGTTLTVGVQSFTSILENVDRDQWLETYKRL